MKSFNTIQELWSYFLFCPVCQDMTREIHMGVGPDDAFILSDFEKNGHILSLNCDFYSENQKRRIKFDINCLDNSFDMDISKTEISSRNVSGASSSHFYCWLNANCRSCNASYANSSDIEINFLTKTVSIIDKGLEIEGIYLLNEESKYFISIDHQSDYMQISKCFISDDGNIIDNNKPFKYPLIDFDFSNPKKLINKIKTLLIFS